MAAATQSQSAPSKPSRLTLIIVIFLSLFALILRLLQLYNYQLYFSFTYGSDVVVDRVGESYHRWLMDILTIQNLGAYSDYASPPNQTAFWPPLYNYLTIALMLITGDRTILAPHIVSLIAGTFTAPLIYLTSRRVFDDEWRPLIAASIAATLPWHVDYSVLAVPHTLVGLLIVLAVYYYIRNSVGGFAVASALSLLAGYEAWFITLILLLYARYFRGWKYRAYRPAFLIPLAVAAGWTVYTIGVSADPLGWFGRHLANLGWTPAFNLAAAGFYIVETLRVVFFIFFLGVAFGLYHNAKSRVVAFIVACFVLAASFARVIALDAGDIGRLVPIYPLMAIAFAPTIPKLRKSTRRRILLVGVLVVLMIVPHVAQASIETGPKKAFIQMPEYRAGLALAEQYNGGRVIADGPTTIYYSQVDPSMFLAFKDLAWYGENPSNEKLANWLRDNDIRWIVWENASFSDAQKILPQLATASTHQIANAQLIPVYEDTLRKRRELEQQGIPNAPLWEHLPKFGGTTPEVILYRLEFGTSPLYLPGGPLVTLSTIVFDQRKTLGSPH
jgi:hypothetical protein